MHLTDDQLNEYLDHESTERAQIEAHLAACSDCAARFVALQALFAEIESLPELTLSRNLRERRATPLRAERQSQWDAAPFTRLQLPRFLTLTIVLQTVIALIAILLAAPFITNILPAIDLPSLTETLLQIQLQWTAWLDFEVLSAVPLPPLPQLPALEISSLMLTLTLVGVSVLWVLGNGLLLRTQLK